jgi:thiol-disulfide isomerase/thioredoxin
MYLNKFFALSAVLCFSLFMAQAQDVKQLQPVMQPADILKNFDSYYVKYEYPYIKLSDNYVAYDEQAHVIPKGRFLQNVSGGGYLPLRLKNTSGQLIYQLYRLPKSINSDIRNRIGQLGQQYEQYYKMEGRPLPDFNFTDLNGKKYNVSTTQGKVLLLKCWYIGCTVCVQEMPRLNQLVKEYKNQPNVLFVSLAFDNKYQLNAFLRKTQFDYATVPNMENYMMKELKIRMYPTHLIIKNGKIVKVVGDVNDLVSAIHQQVPVAK